MRVAAPVSQWIEKESITVPFAASLMYSHEYYLGPMRCDPNVLRMALSVVATSSWAIIQAARRSHTEVHTAD